MKQITGGCLCGAVRLVASGEPDRVGVCHCMDCRKHHGAVFHASAVYPEEKVSIEGKVNAYQGRFFCPKCGSSVYSTSEGEVEVHLGALDEPNQMTPTYELWTTRRETWLPEFPVAKTYEKDRVEE
ncbi:Glutathione-dependent formaldehyde-activating enzyme [Pseudovibrio sp. Ad13]|uniref:GFA family protein n=1 Tax=unclassified Pseudovibrio TaxID=2627060 RepID=UPI0007AE88F4|nr:MULTISPECIES: GFA family protein [unclassified Pseudovibrio]KZK84717.1 Glutathione-dependent formaldehyde-activating enzyme [Pseudovibrio sp. Ad13]KZK90465.1 Glutathione-dependent formaldehyde-activating enzyme [Pseudovibrio sp. Ad46]KZK92813.1 Glutathione-dependent formaldehyde-activating enzyme [Pseudovibrio sp. Ad5]